MAPTKRRKMKQLLHFYDDQYPLSLGITSTINLFLEEHEDVEYVQVSVSSSENVELVAKYEIDSAPTLVAIKDDGSFRKHKEHVIVPEITALFA
jgi:alpha-acetolactate decarboxylase